MLVVGKKDNMDKNMEEEKKRKEGYTEEEVKKSRTLQVKCAFESTQENQGKMAASRVCLVC